MFADMWMSVCACVWIYVHTCGGLRMSQDKLLITSPHMIRVSPWTQSSPFLVDWVASFYQGLVSLLWVYWMTGGPSVYQLSGPENVHAAGIFPTESSPRPWFILLKFKIIAKFYFLIMMPTTAVISHYLCLSPLNIK